MNTNEHEYIQQDYSAYGLSDNDQHVLFREEVFGIMGCAMRIMNVIGNGFPEKIYENALIVEFDEQKIPYRQQPRFPISYKSRRIGEFVPDLVVFEKVIVDTKTIDRISPQEKGQMLNYLRATSLQLGLIVNFKNARIEWERIVL